MSAEYTPPNPQSGNNGGATAAAATIVSDAIPAERAAFIRRTYAHLAGAIGIFTVLEVILFQTTIPETFWNGLSAIPFSWMGVMGAFALVSWLASRVANFAESRELQYAALGAYVLAEVTIFMPMLYIASQVGGAQTISAAALLTLMLVTGLTVAVFATGADFSWMKSILCIGGFIAFGVCVASILLGFNLGIVFAAIMVCFAAGSILYDTSNILHHYRTDQHVGAALSLFASVGLLFWYILRIVMSFSNFSISGDSDD